MTMGCVNGDIFPGAITCMVDDCHVAWSGYAISWWHKVSPSQVDNPPISISKNKCQYYYTLIILREKNDTYGRAVAV